MVMDRVGEQDSKTPITAPQTLTSIIIAARNEEKYIGNCLEALLAQVATTGPLEVVVSANTCTDDTVKIANSYDPLFAKRGWILRVLDSPQPGKIHALNRAEKTAQGTTHIYLDADVTCEPLLIEQLQKALETDEARYATGTLQIADAETWVTRCYAKFWARLPFIQNGAVGAGLFAVNETGRQRWGVFPEIISDDTFVRLQFSPDERVEVPARYIWPMVEGFRNLVRVRKRQDEGVLEVHRLYPDLQGREGKEKMPLGGLFKLLLQAPISFIVYGFVHVAVRLRPSRGDWTRGR